MAHFVIWLDSEKAEVFDLRSSGVVKFHVRKSGMTHHTHNENDHHGDPATEHFFTDLAGKLKGAEELLLLGPGLGKNHFKSHLEKHDAKGLFKKVIGTENCDHPTDNQIVAVARKFFKNYDRFNDPIKPL